MTWTATRQYSEYISVQGRGDGGIFQFMYHPKRKGTNIVGSTIYVRYFDSDAGSVEDPSCSSFLQGSEDNVFVALNKYQKVTKSCLDDCAFDELDDADMQLRGQARVNRQLTELVPLVYADMIANGIAVHDLSATPTGAQVLAAISSAIFSIVANAGIPGGIVLDLTHSGAVFAAMGAAYQPANYVEVNVYAGPPKPVGTYLGIPVFVTPTNLATADATPVPVSALVWASNGYAYAFEGPNMGFKIAVIGADQNPNSTNDLTCRGCIGYGVISEDLVYYILDAA
jgi:hypothetical protein